MEVSSNKIQLEKDGFTIIENIYTEKEIDLLSKIISETEGSGETFRKSADLFAIRQFLKEVPQVQEIIFNDKLKNIINDFFGSDYFSVKSIYFDKPGKSNWFVAYHQDLTVSVNKKTKIENFGPWTVKQNQFAVQPPVEVLENIYTIRVHLDETDKNNGALRVIPKSHLKKIYRPETINWNIETEVTCCVPKSGIMIMKPLLLHSSGRTINNSSRRVVHIEFSNVILPKDVEWAEKITVN